MKKIVLAVTALITGAAVPIFLLLTAAGLTMRKKPHGMLEQMASLHHIGGRYARRLLLPSLALFGATWLVSAASFPTLARRIRTGIVGGLLSGVALDIVRLAGYRAGWMPSDMPVMFGRIIMGPLARKRQVLATGYAYHFLNGIDFGARPVDPGRPGPLAVGRGLGDARRGRHGRLPPVLMSGSGVGMWRKGPKPLAVMMAAHLAMGIVLGLINQLGGGPRGTLLVLLRSGRYPAGFGS